MRRKLRTLYECYLTKNNINLAQEIITTPRIRGITLRKALLSNGEMAGSVQGLWNYFLKQMVEIFLLETFNVRLRKKKKKEGNHSAFALRWTG